MKLITILILSHVLLVSASNANALVAIDSQHKSEIAADIQNHFSEKVKEVVSNSEDEPVLSAKDQKVMLKALYAGVSAPLSLAGVHIDEQGFYAKVGTLLVKGAELGVLPSAITIGFFNRADLIVGKSRGTEMNFYLEEGKLKVSSYDLKTLQVGIAASFQVGYYVALCFGSCTGGDAVGTYIGIDADIIFGVGANIYVEVGVDTTDYYKAKKIGQSYSTSELYEAKAVYIGAGFEFGLGMGLSMGFTEYTLMSDQVLIDLYSVMNQPTFKTDVKAAFKRANLFKSGPRLY
jgi:hypothetical protein